MDAFNWAMPQHHSRWLVPKNGAEDCHNPEMLVFGLLFEADNSLLLEDEWKKTIVKILTQPFDLEPKGRLHDRCHGTLGGTAGFCSEGTIEKNWKMV